MDAFVDVGGLEAACAGTSSLTDVSPSLTEWTSAPSAFRLDVEALSDETVAGNDPLRGRAGERDTRC